MFNNTSCINLISSNLSHGPNKRLRYAKERITTTERTDRTSLTHPYNSHAPASSQSLHRARVAAAGSPVQQCDSSAARWARSSARRPCFVGCTCGTLEGNSTAGPLKKRAMLRIAGAGRSHGRDWVVGRGSVAGKGWIAGREFLADVGWLADKKSLADRG